MVNDVHIKVIADFGDGNVKEYELGSGKPATYGGGSGGGGGSGSNKPQAIYPRPKAQGAQLLHQTAENGQFFFAIPYGADTDGVKWSEKVKQARMEWQEKDADLWCTFNGDNEKDGKTYKGTGYWMCGRAPKYGMLSANDVSVVLDTFKSFGFEVIEKTLLK